MSESKRIGRPRTREVVPISEFGRKVRHNQMENGSYRLNLEKAEEIRARVAAGEKRRDLADEYGVGLATVGEIVRGHAWQK